MICSFRVLSGSCLLTLKLLTSAPAVTSDPLSVFAFSSGLFLSWPCCGLCYVANWFSLWQYHWLLISYSLSLPQWHMENSASPSMPLSKGSFSEIEAISSTLSAPKYPIVISTLAVASYWPGGSLWSGSGSLSFHISTQSTWDFSHSSIITSRVLV